MKTFEHRSIIPGTAEQVMAFYSTPNAPTRLTPPPIFFRINDDRRTSIQEGELEFTLWFGPIPFRWLSRHEPGPTEYSFVDRMLTGPMAVWVHEHIATDMPGGVEIRDRIQIAHKAGLAGLFTRLFFDGLPLRILFIYRQMATRAAVRHIAQDAALRNAAS
ncbi:MAG: hypothetical protein IPK19_31895 [Chloroflexi bacterium]|nr:hypothetical protein [Chloroflexota bacterium]